MLGKIIENYVPVLLLQVAGVSQEDKQLFARLLINLCSAYLDDDSAGFAGILSNTNFSDSWKSALMRALWPESAYENPGK